jgi:Tol biopolymer transport system component
MDISILSLADGSTSKPLIHSAFNELNAAFSPDGRWIAYQSTESGKK